MIKWIAITILSTGILAGGTGNGSKAIALEPGRVYQTGSPLSQPGILGWAAGVTGMRSGGGFETWQGPYVAPGDDAYNVVGGWAPAAVGQFVNQSSGMTLEQANAALAVTAGSTENKQRAIVPVCDGQLYVSWLADKEIGARAQYTCKEEK